MSTTNLSSYDPTTVPDATGRRFAIVISEWNSQVTNAMGKGAIDTLRKYGVAEGDIDVEYVPGSYELIHACNRLTRRSDLDAIIAIGCIVRGETPHFDYLSEAVAVNLGKLNTEADMPIIFGVLTTNDLQQALDRSGGCHGNKGVEAAVTALKLVARFPKV